jgi:hypothetical protein
MSLESTRDGFLVEFEDCVDFLGVLLWPYIEKSGLIKDWEKIEAEGKGLDIGTNKPEFTRTKRFRIMEKMKLIMGIMAEKNILFREIPVYEFEINPDDPAGDPIG